MYEVSPTKLSQIIAPQVSNHILLMIMGKCGGTQLQTRDHHLLRRGLHLAFVAKKYMSSGVSGEATNFAQVAHPDYTTTTLTPLCDTSNAIHFQ
jgi:hypothetical protein